MISFTINIILNFTIKIDYVPHLLFTPVYQQYNLYKDRSNYHEKKIVRLLFYLLQ